MAEGFVQQLREQVTAAAADQRPLQIRGQGSKAFYGRAGDGEAIELSGYSGVVAYEPTELVATVRAGTPLTELEAALAEAGQMLPFEPPRFAGAGTVGGAIATALSGPRRPYAGAARDFVLGVRCINGRGEELSFGGRVMKNVAGYDLSRLLTGSLGTLAVLLEISLKVLPRPETEAALTLALPPAQGLAQVDTWVGENLPVTGCAHDGERLHVRLSGAEAAVQAAARQIGGESEAIDYWAQLRDHDLAFFQEQGTPLWRLALPGGRPLPELPGQYYLDWGGRQLWLRTEAAEETIRDAAAAVGGHATLFRGGARTSQVFQPLPPALMALQQRVKRSLDPAGILNPGRLYAEL